MRAGSRKESVESRGTTSWNDGLHPEHGGSASEVPGILSKAESPGTEPGSAQRGDDGGVPQKAWFAPVETEDCPGGVCPVPWAKGVDVLKNSTYLTVDRNSNFPGENTIPLPFRPEVQPDLINHPSHYQDQGGVECIEAIESQLSEEAFQGYLHGNCVKYLWRWKNKGGVQDLKKCRWYLDRLIAQEEN